MQLKDLSIGKKLGLVSALLLASLLLLGGVAFVTLASLSAAQRNLGSTQIPAIRAITITDMYHDSLEGVVYKSLAASELKDAAKIGETRKDADEAMEGIKSNFQKLDSLDLNLETKKMASETKVLIDRYVEAGGKFIDLALSGQRDKAVAMMPEFNEAFDNLKESLDTLQDNIQANADKSVEESAASAARATPMLVVTIVIGLAASLTAILLFARGLLGPLSEMTGIAARLAEGNIDQSVTFSSRDELGQLAESFRRSIDYTRAIAAAIESISGGRLDAIDLQPKSSHDVLSNNVMKVGRILKDLNAETRRLIEAAEEGDLASRGETARFEGDFAALVRGINEMLDAVSKPIIEASDCLRKVAERDLTVKMKGVYKGEFAVIEESLNTALTNLDSGMRHIADGAEQVAEAASQISQGSQSLAQSSSEQASTLEEVSSSMQEISSMTKQNAANSLEARTISESARRRTEEGKANMERLQVAVEQIKQSSDSTVRIVKTIEEIAFQTNLLALNAAVEAARAGDAGKGFAVVAEEVRNLAMRSGEAAKSTAQLIEESVRNTDNGVIIQSEVSQNLEDILVEIEKVSAVSSEIATATEQQHEGIAQINAAFEQMNIATQQTAANSEESASASEQLSGQSQEMLNLIASFTLNRNEGGKHMPSAARRGGFAASQPYYGAN